MNAIHPIFLFLNIGSSEMILIVFVALMLFGGDKLPQIAKGLGKGIRDFKDASEGVKRELQNQIENFDAKPAESAPGHTDADLNFPKPDNTVTVSDPFASAPAVAEHETPLLEEHHTTQTNIETTTLKPEGSHADVPHLTGGHEVTKVSENHLEISHVSDENKAGEHKEQTTK